MERERGEIKPPAPVGHVVRSIHLADRSVEDLIDDLHSHEWDGLIVIGLRKNTRDVLISWASLNGAELAYLSMILDKEVKEVL